jgi:hypothetical protein
MSRWAGQQIELFFGIVGGTSSNATVTVSEITFYSAVPPSLQAQANSNSLIVTWPLSAANYILETTDNLALTNSWTTVTNVPVVMTFQNTVTIETSEGSRFYRLRQQ